MDILNKSIEELKEKNPNDEFELKEKNPNDEFEFEVGCNDNDEFEFEVGCNDKDRLELIEQSIEIIKDSGDKEKLTYVTNLFECYKILFNLRNLLKSNPILNEEEVKYHCEDLYHFLVNIVDNSNRIITGIIGSIANDIPLDIFYKYLMRPNF